MATNLESHYSMMSVETEPFPDFQSWSLPKTMNRDPRNWTSDRATKHESSTSEVDALRERVTDLLKTKYEEKLKGLGFEYQRKAAMLQVEFEDKAREMRTQYCGELVQLARGELDLDENDDSYGNKDGNETTEDLISFENDDYPSCNIPQQRRPAHNDSICLIMAQPRDKPASNAEHWGNRNAHISGREACSAMFGEVEDTLHSMMSEDSEKTRVASSVYSREQDEEQHDKEQDDDDDSDSDTLSSSSSSSSEDEQEEDVLGEMLGRGPTRDLERDRHNIGLVEMEFAALQKSVGRRAVKKKILGKVKAKVVEIC